MLTRRMMPVFALGTPAFAFFKPCSRWCRTETASAVAVETVVWTVEEAKVAAMVVAAMAVVVREEGKEVEETVVDWVERARYHGTQQRMSRPCLRSQWFCQMYCLRSTKVETEPALGRRRIPGCGDPIILYSRTALRDSRYRR